MRYGPSQNGSCPHLRNPSAIQRQVSFDRLIYSNASSTNPHTISLGILNLSPGLNLVPVSHAIWLSRYSPYAFLICCFIGLLTHMSQTCMTEVMPASIKAMISWA